MNRRQFLQSIGCTVLGAMAGGAMAAEAADHEPRRPNLPYVFAVELRAQGLMEPYKAVDVEALCAKRPNVHQRGHAGALTAANRFCTAMPPSPASTNRSAVCSTDRNAWGSSAQTILGQKICPPRPRPVDKPKAPANGSNGRKRAAKRKIVLHTAVLSMPKPLPSRFPKIILDVVCHCRQRRTAVSFVKESAERRIACGKGAKRNSHRNVRESP